MTTLFTQIIDGEIPGHFVWRDEVCVAFLVIDPLTDGHTIVVPREEIAEWTEASPETLSHLTRVAQSIGRAQQAAWSAARVGLLAEGYAVPHLHLHVWPTQSTEQFDLHAMVRGQDQAVLAKNAEILRAALREHGHGEWVPAGE